MRALDLGDQVVRVTHDLIGLFSCAGDQFGSGPLRVGALLDFSHSSAEIGYLSCESIQVVCDATTQIVPPFGRNQQPDPNTDDGAHKCTQYGTRETSTLN